MQYEQTGNPSHPHKLTFEGGEPVVVCAAYREHMFYLALKGNTGSMSDYEAYISSWEEDGEKRTVRPLKPTDVAEVLEDFADRTEEAIQSIPESTGVPAFLSDEIGERFRLGKLATKLAQEIRDIAAPPEELPPLEDLTVDTSDGALRRWLDNR